MNILLVMIPLSIVLLGIAAYAFSRAVDDEQFEDFDHAQLLPLMDSADPVRADDDEVAQ